MSTTVLDRLREAIKKQREQGIPPPPSTYECPHCSSVIPVNRDVCDVCTKIARGPYIGQVFTPNKYGRHTPPKS
jgi:hypothetical protein